MKNNSQKPSYEGKEVFVGIDVHKKTYSVVSIVEGAVVKKWRTKAKPEQLVKQLQSYFPGAKIYSAYEAGFSGFVLHRQLEKQGIENVVVNRLCCTHSCIPDFQIRLPSRKSVALKR